MLVFSRFARYFAEVARLGSLRRAAEALHVSASAIDRQILMAEQEYGAALFERLPGGMRLTAAGELLLGDLRRWRKEYARTLERFDELQGLRRGHVSLACMNALSTGALPAALARMGEELPGIGFDVQVLENRQVAAQVAAGEVDFGLVLEPQPAAQLQMRPLRAIALGMAVPPGHPLAGVATVNFGGTMEFRHIVAGDALMIGARVRALYERHQGADKPVMRCNDVRMMRSLIERGAGIGVLSWLDVAADVADGRLAFVPLHGGGGEHLRPLTLALCVAPQRQLSRAAQWAIERVTAALSAMPLP